MGISDRSGAAYKLKDMRKEWTGMLVGKDEWEAKQPQLTVVATPADPRLYETLDRTGQNHLLRFFFLSTRLPLEAAGQPSLL